MAGETKIFNPKTGKSPTIKHLAENQINPTVLTSYGLVVADIPFRKGVADLYRVTMSSGQSFLATAKHLVLTTNGWGFVEDLSFGDVLPLSSPFRQASIEGVGPLGFLRDAQHSFQTPQDSGDYYSAYCRQYDERLPLGPGSGQGILPLPAGVHGHNRGGRGVGDLAFSIEHIRHRQSSCHHASVGYSPLFGESGYIQSHYPQKTDGYGACSYEYAEPSRITKYARSPIFPVVHDFDSTRPLDDSDVVLSNLGSYSQYYTAHLDTVSSIKYERTDEFFDMHVPGAEHYYAEGFWHHNTGKTWATVWLLDSLLRSTPKSEAVLARKLHVTVGPSVLRTYKTIQSLREELGQKPSVPYGGEKPEWYSYSNGAKLWIVGIDKPGKALSSERDWIYINQAEELDLEDWETLTTRCTGRGAVTKTPMMFGDCNPSAEDHWILKRKTIKLFHSTHEDNPSLFDEAGALTEQGIKSMAILDGLTGVRYSRLRKGLWVGAEGLFFEEFDEKLHTCDPFDIPGDALIWGAFDYGFSHNTAFGVFTESDGEIILVGEHVQNKLLPPMHCKAIRRVLERCKIPMSRLTQIVAGHDCFQTKGDSQGKTIAQQYAEARDPDTNEAIGIKMEMANISRIPGASEMLARLGNAKLGIKPRFKIVNTCRRSISGMTRMVCDPRDPEDVLKVDCDQNGNGGDDEYDMIRYGVMARQPKSTKVHSFQR